MSEAIDALLQELRGLSQEQKDELLETVNADRGLKLWAPTPGPQYDAYHSEADELFYGGAAGGGKALRSTTPVVTPFGYKPIGKLKVGDTVIAGDGTPTKVIGVYPQGVRPLYRVSFADGGYLDADDEHLWNYSIARKGKWRKSGREWKVATTGQLRTLMESGSRILIPLSGPMRLTKSYRYEMRKIDPYVLGLLLGDGHIANRKVAIASADFEILNQLPGFPDDWRKDGKYDFASRGETREFLMQELERIGIYGKRAWEKTIPEPYLWGNVETRTALLQGLMDTDGTCTPDGKAYFCSVSETLAKQVRWLVFSLGGRATITDKQPFFRDSNNEIQFGRKAYDVYIRMPDNRVLFRLDRKKALTGTYNGTDVTLKRRIVSIEPVEPDEAVCIRVDHPESLYVAGEHLVVTHNTALIVGLALTKHIRTLVIRLESTQLRGFHDDISKTLGTRDGLNVQAGQWRIPGHLSPFPGEQQLIEFGGVPAPGDEEKHQGIPHDLLAFDEVTQLSEYVVDYLSTWNRPTGSNPNQRCRILLTSNPPTPSTQRGSKGASSGGGLWLIRRYAPWLDPQYRDPLGKGKALPGELRWFAMIDGSEREVENGLPFINRRGKPDEEFIIPRSRTFIPAKVGDNPYLSGTQYQAVLQKLPEPLRSAMLYGDFSISLSDRPLQLFPTEWVRAAMTRWHVMKASNPSPTAHPNEMTAVGCDMSRGGQDNCVFAPRYHNFYAELVVMPGASVPTGPDAAGEIVKVRRDRARMVVDTVGIGASAHDHLCNVLNLTDYVDAYIGSSSATLRDNSGLYSFTNKRSESYWKFREELDPASRTEIALPPDDDLMHELLAHTYEIQQGNPPKIKVITKDDVVKALGRSPDRSDAVIMASTVEDDAQIPQSWEQARKERVEKPDDRLPSDRHLSWSDPLPYPKRY